MTRTRRLTYFGLILLAQAIYLPLNRFLQSGMILKLPLDDLIPIQPIWSIPYGLWMISWIGLWLWAALRMPDQLYKKLFASAMVTILLAMATFILMPTYVPRKPVDPSALGAVFLQSIYAADGLFCAFPSGHIYLCTLTAIFFSRWHPRSKWVWIVILGMVSISTLLTGQHFILDIPAGMIYAFVGVYIGNILTSRTKIKKRLANW